ncbi:MAG TPA: radical SAM protein [Gemmataceae bacterium]|nr:radical SAM protein [Gemmataceae bacterium]
MFSLKRRLRRLWPRKRRPLDPVTRLKKEGPLALSVADAVAVARGRSPDELRAMFAGDPWLTNYVVNLWEYATRQTHLTTYPWKVVIPMSDVCNATCTFCNSWLRGVQVLKPDDVRRFKDVLRYAVQLGLEGHGEPLVNPHFEEVVNEFSKIVDPRCRKYMITNAARLDRHFDLVQRLNVNTFSISLNAATPATHHEVMGLGPDAFERIVASLRRLIAARDARGDMAVHITMVVLNQNVQEVARFIELGNELNVDSVWLRTLLPTQDPRGSGLEGLNYHTLPAYLNPDFEEARAEAVAAIAASRVPVVAEPDSWSVPTFPEAVAERIRLDPPRLISKDEAKARHKVDLSAYHDEQSRHWRGRKTGAALSDAEIYGTENPFDRSPGYGCIDVYSVLHLNDFLYVLRPCCYMENPPGYEFIHYDGSYPFFEAWNSPAMVEIRRTLRDGPLLTWCKRCPSQPQH